MRGIEDIENKHQKTRGIGDIENKHQKTRGIGDVENKTSGREWVNVASGAAQSQQ